MVDHLVNGGLSPVVMRLGKAPNLSKIYKKPMMDNMIRAKDIIDMQVPIRRCWYESQQSRLGNSVGESRFGAMASALLVHQWCIVGIGLVLSIISHLLLSL
jgi:hypothetical protein